MAAYPFQWSCSPSVFDEKVFGLRTVRPIEQKCHFPSCLCNTRYASAHLSQSERAGTQQHVRYHNWSNFGRANSVTDLQLFDVKNQFRPDSICIVRVIFEIYFNLICNFRAHLKELAASPLCVCSPVISSRGVTHPSAQSSPLGCVRSVPPVPESALKFAYGAALITPVPPADESRRRELRRRAFVLRRLSVRPSVPTRRHGSSALPLVTGTIRRRLRFCRVGAHSKHSRPNQPVATFADGAGVQYRRFSFPIRC